MRFYFTFFLLVFLFSNCEKTQRKAITISFNETELLKKSPYISKLLSKDSISYVNHLGTIHTYTVKSNKEEKYIFQINQEDTTIFQVPIYSFSLTPTDPNNEISLLLIGSFHSDKTPVLSVESEQFSTFNLLANTMRFEGRVSLLGQVYEGVKVCNTTNTEAFSTLYLRLEEGVLAYKGRNNTIFVFKES